MNTFRNAHNNSVSAIRSTVRGTGNSSRDSASTIGSSGNDSVSSIGRTSRDTGNPGRGSASGIGSTGRGIWKS